MEIEDLENEYQKQLEIRDSLPFLLEELEGLKEDENVKNYIKISTLLNDYKDIDKSDDEILKNIIRNNKINLNLPDYYLGLGKNLSGSVNENGEYYILKKDYVAKRFNHVIKVAKYRSFEDPNDIVIIPMKEVEKFEKEHIITPLRGDNLDKEYNDYRVKIFKSELEGYKEMELTKKR